MSLFSKHPPERLPMIAASFTTQPKTKFFKNGEKAIQTDKARFGQPFF